MTTLKPLNISILELTAENLKDVKQVKSLFTFTDATKNFTQDGLFSTEIFGKVGDVNRNYTFAFINLKIEIIHPILFKAICELKEFYFKIFEGSEYAVFDKQTKEFIKSNPVDGKTGYHFFIEHFKDLDLRIQPTHSRKRKNTLKLISKYKSVSLMSKLLVLPAGLRDYEIDKNNKPTEGEVNAFYRRCLSLSNQVIESALKTNPEIQDKLRFTIQETVNDIYNYFEDLLKGKNKLIQGKWVSRNVQLSSRNVIGGLKSNLIDFNEINTDVRHVSYGLYQFLKITVPLTIFLLRNAWLSKVFLGQNYPMQVTDSKTLTIKTVPFNYKEYDKWMGEEGIGKLITSFGTEAYRTRPVMVGTDYAGLVYITDKFFKFIHDISEVPKEDKSKVRPITLVDLFYQAVYKEAKTIPVEVTRYPIESAGSTFMAMTDLRTSNLGLTLKEYQDDIVVGETSNYPLLVKVGDSFESELVDFIVLHPNQLSGLKADMDGDTISLIPLLSVESKAEIKKSMTTVNHYLFAGKLKHSNDTGIASQLINIFTS